MKLFTKPVMNPVCQISVDVSTIYQVLFVAIALSTLLLLSTGRCYSETCVVASFYVFIVSRDLRVVSLCMLVLNRCSHQLVHILLPVSLLL